MSISSEQFIVFTEPELERFADKIVQKVRNSFHTLTSKPQEKKLLTKDDFAQEYGFSLGAINKMVFQKEIEFVKPHNKIHFTREAIENYIAKHTQKIEGSK